MLTRQIITPVSFVRRHAPLLVACAIAALCTLCVAAALRLVTERVLVERGPITAVSSAPTSPCPSGSILLSLTSSGQPLCEADRGEVTAAPPWTLLNGPAAQLTVNGATTLGNAITSESLSISTLSRSPLTDETAVIGDSVYSHVVLERGYTCVPQGDRWVCTRGEDAR